MNDTSFSGQLDTKVKFLVQQFTKAQNSPRMMEIAGEDQMESRSYASYQEVNFAPHRPVAHQCDCVTELNGNKADICARMLASVLKGSGAEDTARYTIMNPATGERSDRKVTYRVNVTNNGERFLDRLGEAAIWVDKNMGRLHQLFDVGIIAQNDINSGVRLPSPPPVDQSGVWAARDLQVGTKFYVRIVPEGRGFSARIDIDTNHPGLIAKLKNNPHLYQESLREWQRNDATYYGGYHFSSNNTEGSQAVEMAIKEVQKERGLGSGPARSN